MKLFVGGINPSVSSHQLESLFSTYGRVLSAKIVRGQKNQYYSKCFGFVVMPSDECAQLAIERLDGQELEGSNITVNKSYKKATPEPEPFVFRGYR